MADSTRAAQRIPIGVQPVPLPGHAVGEEGLCVEFHATRFARKLGPEPLEAGLAERWDEKRKANPRLFNGSKFRWAGWDEPGAPGEKLAMRLGLSSYRMFQGTNAAPCALELVNYGIGSHSDPGACMGNALGIGMAVLCTDGRLLFIRRSQHVGEARGLVDLIGGHSEPSAAGLAPAMLLDDDEVPEGWAPSPRLRPLHAPAAAEACPPASANAAARRELFASALDEVVEEMNLPRDALGPPLLLGTSCNFTTGGRVALAFVVPFAGSADDAVRRYREVPAEAFESTAMLHLPAQEVLDAVQRAGVHEADDTAGWATTADGAGRASEVAEAIVGAAEPGTWRPVFELALHGAVETPSACPAGDSGEVADAAPAPGPKSLQPSQIAPACMAALVLFALAAEAHGGVDGLQAAIRATSSA